jgi:large subunit ribosomal protein L3e
MSHRKFEAPRHGSLRFLPRKRSRRHRGRIRSFPPDNKKKEPHLTAFIGYKAGMTHVLRQLKRPGSKAHEKDIVEAVTIIETPPMMVVGLVGYVKTPAGLRSITSVWASHLDDSFRRRFYKNWTRSKKKAFTKWQQKWAAAKDGKDPAEVERRLKFIKKYADVVRVIAHSQVKKLKNLGLKKAHIMEIQVNGGTVDQKVDFGYKLFEKPVDVKSIFHQNELLDTIGVTKGHGFKGVVSRFGVAKLPRKTHRGRRKVACIGPWHPPRVSYTVARAGQKGYHHRTELHKKIYRIGEAIKYGEDGKPLSFNASTEFDLTEKNITPMGGFIRYGVVKQDYIMIKGTCIGPRKRPITLRKAIVQPSGSGAAEEIDVKFIDTSSQYGNGRFQTSDEKKKYFGTTKKDRLREQAKKTQERKQKKSAQAKKSKEAPQDSEKKPDAEAQAEPQAKKSKSSPKGSKKKGGKSGKGSKKKGSGKKKKNQGAKTERK